MSVLTPVAEILKRLEATLEKARDRTALLESQVESLRRIVAEQAGLPFDPQAGKKKV